MSISGKSIRSSILKVSNTSLKERLNETLARTKLKVKFTLPESKRLINILQNYLNDSSDSKEYERLIGMILNADLDDDDVVNLLQEATQIISLLNQDLRLFVEALLTIKWTGRSKKVVKEYQSFLLNLLSAHNYHTKYAIETLVSNFITGNYIHFS